MFFDIEKRALAYLEPMMIVLVAVYGFFAVLVEIVVLQRNPKDIGNLTVFRERIFAKAWLMLGPRVAKAELDTMLPALISQARGVVIELGPGSGHQLSRYDASKITRIYGVEPNVNLYPALRASIKSAKLDDIYTIVPCGIENLAEMQKHGIERESVDTVLSAQVLCSVPRPEEVVQGLYPLMKRGGVLIVYEHVRSRDYVTRMIQNLYNLVWPYGLGNCHLDRPTDQYLRNAGPWANIDVTVSDVAEPWAPVPRVIGRLTK